MTRIILTKLEAQILSSWLELAANHAEELSVPFEPDELELVDKIRKQINAGVK